MTAALKNSLLQNTQMFLALSETVFFFAWALARTGAGQQRLGTARDYTGGRDTATALVYVCVNTQESVLGAGWRTACVPALIFRMGGLAVGEPDRRLRLARQGPAQGCGVQCKLPDDAATTHLCHKRCAKSITSMLPQPPGALPPQPGPQDAVLPVTLLLARGSVAYEVGHSRCCALELRALARLRESRIRGLRPQPARALS